MNMTCIVNGADLAEKVNRYDYEVSYQEIEGSNGGTTMAGTKYYDLLAVGVTVRYTVHPLTDEDLRDILAIVTSTPNTPTVQLTYFEPKLGAERTIMAKPNAKTVKYAFRTPTGSWWNGLEMTFEECG